MIKKEMKLKTASVKVFLLYNAGKTVLISHTKVSLAIP